MSLFGDAFGRALAGIGSAGEQLANKYINEELLQQRMQAQEDIRFAGMKREDEYKLSPDRQAKVAAGVQAETAARGRGETEALAERAANKTYQANVRENTSATAQAEAQGRAMGAGLAEKQLGTDPVYLAAKRAVAKAGHIDGVDAVARAQLTNMEIADRQELTGLYKRVIGIENDDSLTQDQKDAKTKPLLVSIQAIKSKNNPGGPAFTGRTMTDVDKETLSSYDKEAVKASDKLSEALQMGNKDQIAAAQQQIAQIDMKRKGVIARYRDVGGEDADRLAAANKAMKPDEFAAALEKSRAVASMIGGKYAEQFNARADELIANSRRMTIGDVRNSERAGSPNVTPTVGSAKAPASTTRADEIRRILSNDDYVKQSLFGSGARAIERAHTPLSVAVRSELERELQSLGSSR